jgi:hypothetical protein
MIRARPAAQGFVAVSGKPALQASTCNVCQRNRNLRQCAGAARGAAACGLVPGAYLAFLPPPFGAASGGGVSAAMGASEAGSGLLPGVPGVAADVANSSSHSRATAAPPILRHGWRVYSALGGV